MLEQAKHFAKEECGNKEKLYDVAFQIVPNTGLNRNLKISLKPNTQMQDTTTEFIPGIRIYFTDHSFYNPYELYQKKLHPNVKVNLPNNKFVDLESLYYSGIGYTPGISDVMLDMEITRRETFSKE